MPQFILVAGPTASGKSQLAMQIARRTGGTIVNADSMQLFRDLPILTAQPTGQDYATCRHELYGVITRWHERPTVAWWYDHLLDTCKRSGFSYPAIITGGTGFYLRALTHGITDLPTFGSKTQAYLDDIDKQGGYPAIKAAYLRLRHRLRLEDEADLEAFPKDRQRARRVLGILYQTGQSLCQLQQKSPQSRPPLVTPHNSITILVDDARPKIIERAEKRIEAMIAGGVLAEVGRVLAAPGFCTELPLTNALGFAEIQQYLEGQKALEETKKRILRQTRRYIKRQQTWFRHQYRPDLVFFIEQKITEEIFHKFFT